MGSKASAERVMAQHESDASLAESAISDSVSVTQAVVANVLLSENLSYLMWSALKNCH